MGGRDGWRTSVGQDGGLGQRCPAPCSVSPRRAGLVGWKCGPSHTSKGLHVEIKGRTPHAKGRKGNEKRAPPHCCSGAVLPDSYFLHDCWGQILNVFLQTTDGSSWCSAVIFPCSEPSWSSTRAHLHRKSMKLLGKGEYAQLRWSAGLFLGFRFFLAWLESWWESDFLSHTQWYACNCFLTSLPPGPRDQLILDPWGVLALCSCPFNLLMLFQFKQFVARPRLKLQNPDVTNCFSICSGDAWSCWQDLKGWV